MIVAHLVFKVLLEVQVHLDRLDPLDLKESKDHVVNQAQAEYKGPQGHKVGVEILEHKVLEVTKEVQETKEKGALKDIVDSLVFKVYLEHKVKLESQVCLDNPVRRDLRETPVLEDLLVRMERLEILVLLDLQVHGELVEMMVCRDLKDLQDLVVLLVHQAKQDMFHWDSLQKDPVDTVQKGLTGMLKIKPPLTVRQSAVTMK